MKNRILTFLSCAAIAVSVWALIGHTIETERQPMEELWVQLSPWPIDEFIVNWSENKLDSPRVRLSVELINGSQHSRRCFVQVDGKGIGAGNEPDVFYTTFVSRVIDLANVNTQACRTRLDLMLMPSEETLFSYDSVIDYFLDVKVVDYETRKILYHRRCYYYLAIEGSENLHLYKPVELHPSDSEKYKDCECVPKPVRNKLLDNTGRP